MATVVAVEPQPRPFTVEEYERLWEADIFGDEERLELIDGVISRLHPREAAHIWAVSRLMRMMARRDDTVLVSLCPVRISDNSMLLADAALLPSSVWRRIAPKAKDMLLVIEVADLSLDHDRVTKAPLYARADIPEYWIVDLNGERIEVYTEPSKIGYRVLHVYGHDEQIAPGFSADLRVDVSTILGPVGEADDDEDGPSAE
jgi:Uma2 family endonuclease